MLGQYLTGRQHHITVKIRLIFFLRCSYNLFVFHSYAGGRGKLPSKNLENANDQGCSMNYEEGACAPVTLISQAEDEMDVTDVT